MFVRNVVGGNARGVTLEQCVLTYSEAVSPVSLLRIKPRAVPIVRR